jgi:shikimate dehydrogenase
MRISGTTRVFLVVGDPVSQVQAPRVFNPIFERHGVDAVLVPAQVHPDRFPDFARHVLAAGNIDGLWLTIPHKPAAAALVDTCNRAAEMAGSVNAVRRVADGRLDGAMFDGVGFVKAARHFGFEPP